DDNPAAQFHAFDMMIPRQYNDAASFTENWYGFFEKHAQAIDVCEDEEMVIHSSGDLATARFVMIAEVTDKSGQTIKANTRMTHIFQRIEGKWLIVHEHASYPIDWQTGMADMLSKP
ncbi:MAG: nuclear transport factor 2 family protein, partial [Novosphingobium sp.]